MLYGGLEEGLGAEHVQGEGGCLDCGSHGGIGLIDRVLEVLGGLVERRGGVGAPWVVCGLGLLREAGQRTPYSS